MSDIMGCLTFLLSTPLHQYLLGSFVTAKCHLLLDGTTITAPGLVFVGVEPCSSTFHATLTDSTSIAGSLMGVNGSWLASNIGSMIGNVHSLGLIRHSCGSGWGWSFLVEYSSKHCLALYGAGGRELTNPLDDRAVTHGMDSVLQSMKLLWGSFF
jgi:hypothetical protein